MISWDFYRKRKGLKVERWLRQHRITTYEKFRAHLLGLGIDPPPLELSPTSLRSPEPPVKSVAVKPPPPPVTKNEVPSAPVAVSPQKRSASTRSTAKKTATTTRSTAKKTAATRAATPKKSKPQTYIDKEVAKLNAQRSKKKVSRVKTPEETS